MTKLEKVIKGLECCNMPNNHDDCPYNGAAHYNICTHQLLTDAIALLKEQEPRVLTLEEVTGGGECYVEYRNGGCGYCDCYFSDDAEKINIYRPLKIDYYADPDCYNKTWRCWTARPTEEQREATPWGEAAEGR